MKDWRIYLKIAIASIKARMEYRGSFFVFILTVGFFYTAQILTIGVIIYRFKSIGGWTIGEMAFLYSLLILSQSIVSFLFSGMLDFSTLVREGTFDRFLVRPISPLGQVISNGFELSGFANLIMGFATFIFANSLVGIDWTMINLVNLVLVILGGAFILGGIRVFISSIAFYAINNQSLIHLFVFSSREFLLYPLNIYSLGTRIILTFVFPLGFINFYPAHLFLNKSSTELFHPYIIYATFPVGLFMIIVSLLFWRTGLSHYESAGA